MKTRYAVLMASLIAAMVLSPAWAAVKGRTVEYRDGDVELQGYFAWDDAVPGKRPGIIVVHEWWGLNDYAKKRADMLAQLGYAALAIDMYGKGKVTEHPQEAGEWAKQIQANVAGWQKRALLGLDILKKDPHVDAQRLAAIGYCFGGATVMEMAYSGADLAGVVSFHGSLPPPTDDQMSKIKARILVAQGSEDAYTPPERVVQFQNALDKAKADWTMITYSGARHSFTVPDADKHGMENLRYNKNADERSWQAMRQFFRELFATAPAR